MTVSPRAGLQLGVRRRIEDVRRVLLKTHREAKISSTTRNSRSVVPIQNDF